jgi:purine-binding chemotaxis protein CheW
MVEKSAMKMAQFVSFRLYGHLYGFDIRIVKEITAAVQMTPVPLKAKDVTGVINIRGQVVVVLDIGVSFGNPEQTIGEDSQIIILKTVAELEIVADFNPNFDVESVGSIPVGFLVQAVGDIVTVEASRIEPAPSHLLSEYRQYVDGVVRLDSKPLVILNPGAILGSAP